jgi:hypothetical protein
MKVCNCRINRRNGNRTCKTLKSIETVEISVTSTCLSVIYPDSQTDRMQKRPLYIESVEICIYMTYAGDTRMLLQYIYEKLTMAKLKSSHLSYN